MTISKNQIELLISDLDEHQQKLMERLNSLPYEVQSEVEESILDHISEIQELILHLKVNYLDLDEISSVSNDTISNGDESISYLEGDDIIFDDDDDFEMSY